MQDRVSFVCRACRWDSAGDAPDLHAPGWAQLAGYDGCVRWLSPRATPAPQGLLLDEAPGSGEEHWLAVRLPFSAVAGEPFYCIYQPPAAYYDGWSEHPEELGRSALVCCTLVAVHSARPDGAEIRVAVEDAWALDKIGSLFQPSGLIKASFWEGFATQTLHDAQWREFIWLQGSFEGDVATSALFEQRDGRRYLILSGLSTHHADFVFAGNSPLDAECETALQRMLARSRAG